jgi:hypothetical protein
MPQYIANCNTHKIDGWEWVIVTDREIEGKDNVRIVKMTQGELEGQIKDNLKVDVDLTAKRRADGRAIGEFHPAFALIFPDLVKGCDFWGYTNNDVIYGRLSHFLPDSHLKDLDIFGNDPEQMNGIFSLLRNTSEVNALFTEIPDWQSIFRGHTYSAFDEIIFTRAVIKARAEKRLRVEFQEWREGDRLYAGMRAIHSPVPQIKMEGNGALMNTVTGEEIMMFHFGGCKRWCV